MTGTIACRKCGHVLPLKLPIVIPAYYSHVELRCPRCATVLIGSAAWPWATVDDIPEARDLTA